MQYQERIGAAQAAERPRDGESAAAAPCPNDANINPATGLATDYLNHFNEAIMLLDLVASCPDCLDDFRGDLLAWQPRGYRAHFECSRFAGRALAIAAYEAADPALRGRLDALAACMTAVLEAARAAFAADLSPEAAGALATRATGFLKPLVARAGAVINGESDASLRDGPQAVIDGLMRR
jgi:hypothetical protein